MLLEEGLEAVFTVTSVAAATRAAVAHWARSACFEPSRIFHRCDGLLMPPATTPASSAKNMPPTLQHVARLGLTKLAGKGLHRHLASANELT